jgi:hypothetical protein
MLPLHVPLPSMYNAAPEWQVWSLGAAFWELRFPKG